jgi:EAL domain-containing protein (putative c-di-GMP-specific phosphodiesterase class I)
MLEFKEILKDSQDNIIPIGSFVAISEKLELNRKFDEDVILKVLEYAKSNAIKYKIAINLSMKTIADEDFIKFLKHLVSKDEDIRKYIVFSITSYSASAYKDDFINFVEEASILKMAVLLKRYKTKEYPLEELAQLDISYIKIDKTLTQNIYNDLIKKHVLKNIIIFADIHEVKLIVENVESDKDFAFLSKQDLYAVNR